MVTNKGMTDSDCKDFNIDNTSSIDLKLPRRGCVSKKRVLAIG